LLDAKSARPDAAQAVLASSAFPHLTEPIPVGVGEKEEYLVNGACGMPLPILAGVKRFRPNTLIVLASRPHPKHLPWFEQWLWPVLTRTALRRMPAGLRKSTAAMDRAMVAEADRLQRLKHIRWCRVTPNGAEVPIKPWTSDLVMLRRAADEAKIFMRTPRRSPASWHGPQFGLPIARRVLLAMSKKPPPPRIVERNYPVHG
jgi:hypothetical protein